MRKESASGERPPARWRGDAAPPRASGFTLIEVLLVMAIIGILSAVVVANFADAGTDQDARTEAERLALAIELARVQALQRNEVWGIKVADDGYAFKRFEPVAGKWHDVEERPFAPWSAAQGIVFTPRTSFGRTSRTAMSARAKDPWAATIPADGDRHAEPPDIAIHPGGEMTPFEIRVAAGGEHDDDAPAWLARSDGLERALALRESKDEPAVPTLRRGRR